MSLVEFKKCHFPCHLNSQFPGRFKGALLSHVKLKGNTPCCVPYIYLVSLISMSHVDFKKWSCRRDKSRGRVPSSYLSCLVCHLV